MKITVNKIGMVNLTEIVQQSTKLEKVVLNKLKELGFGRNSIISSKVLGTLILDSGDTDRILTKHQKLLSLLVQMDMEHLVVFLDVG
jgi:hypothetical protein